MTFNIKYNWNLVSSRSAMTDLENKSACEVAATLRNVWEYTGESITATTTPSSDFSVSVDRNGTVNIKQK